MHGWPGWYRRPCLIIFVLLYLTFRPLGEALLDHGNPALRPIGRHLAASNWFGFQLVGWHWGRFIALAGVSARIGGDHVPAVPEERLACAVDTGAAAVIRHLLEAIREGRGDCVCAPR